jgi:flagellar P-ring protein precursor FlgI
MTKSVQRRIVLFVLGVAFSLTAHSAVRIKDLARFDGVRDNVAVGYGLVVGLAGTGDSQRSAATLQSVSNMLREFGLNVPPTNVASRNVAAVLVTTNLPGFLRTGDRLDVNVSSVGDASSLAGGTLLVTPLLGVNRQTYATAQGALSVGGYKFEQDGTSRQKNHPTAGMIPEGAIAERTFAPVLLGEGGSLDLILNDPDFITATRVATAINAVVSGVAASAIDAGRIRLHPASTGDADIVALIARVEGLGVDPDEKARVVVNERTGTIVSGGNVSLSAVTITQGDIRVAITRRYMVSQPDGTAYFGVNQSGRTVVRPESTVDVDEQELQAVKLEQGATIAELVTALRAIRVSTRDVIAILQGIKRAGALHAELIIQ